MTGNIAFMFLCTLLVFFMTPGLALFYGGMVRRKNVLNTMLCCLVMMGIGIVLWVIAGYSLTFGEDHAGIIGDLSKVFLNNVSMEVDEGGEIPEIITVMFNMMFAVISPAIIFGSLAERVKFSKMVIFMIIWSFLVYYPLAHMAWGGGLLEMIGSIDFAGGNVIHISTGVSGLTACIILGKRRGYGAATYHPHNVPLFAIGACILWVGWFAFNCGCAGSISAVTLLAFCNTAVSSAVSMVVWMIIEAIIIKKCTIMGSLTGAIAGLVGITPGCGYVPVWSSFIIGAVSAIVCYIAISVLKKRFKYDDALDAFGCHGVGGIWGGIATGLFATSKLNEVVPAEGLVFGDYHLFVSQIGAILISCAVAVVMTIIILAVLRCFGSNRVSEKDEAKGLDYVEHGEHSYPAFNGLD